MQVEMKNGHSNGHSNGHNKTTQPEVDEEPEKVRLCCARLDVDDWCALPDKHDSPCKGPSRHYGPIAPPAWEMQKRRWWSARAEVLRAEVKAGTMTHAAAERQIEIAWLFVSKSGVSRG